MSQMTVTCYTSRGEVEMENDTSRGEVEMENESEDRENPYMISSYYEDIPGSTSQQEEDKDLEGGVQDGSRRGNLKMGGTMYLRNRHSFIRWKKERDTIQDEEITKECTESNVTESRWRRVFSIGVLLPVVAVLLITATGFLAWWLNKTAAEEATDSLSEKLRDEILTRVSRTILSKLDIVRSLAEQDRQYCENNKLSVGKMDDIKKLAQNVWSTHTDGVFGEFTPTTSLAGNEEKLCLILSRQQSNVWTWSVKDKNPGLAGNLTGHIFHRALPEMGINYGNPLYIQQNYDATTRPWYTFELSPNSTIPVQWADPLLAVVPYLRLEMGAGWKENNETTGEKIGQCGKGLSLGFISEFLKSLMDDRLGDVFVYEKKNGYLVGSSEGKVHTGEGASIRRIYATESESKVIRKAGNYLLDKYGTFSGVDSSTKREFEDGDTTYYLQTTSISSPENVNIDWIAVVLLDKDYIMKEVVEGSTNATISTFAMVFAAIILFVIISFFITRPIRRLSRDLLALAVLDFDALSEQTVSNFHEIRMVQRSFAVMRSGIAAFCKYVPYDLVRKILRAKSTEAVTELKMEPRDVTVFFLDIVNFTRFSESNPPEVMLELVSEFFDEMSSIILSGGGTIDKYIGDAIMAFWNAPHTVPRHRRASVRAAWQCLLRLKQLQTKWMDEGKPTIDCRIGLHSGSALVGNFGCSIRMDYTVVGDVVNTASRLEGLNKLFSTRLLISEDVYREAGLGYLCRYLGEVKVVGKEHGTKIFEVVCPKDEANEEKRRAVEEFSRAVSYFNVRNFEEGREKFVLYEKLMGSSDAASQYYISLCDGVKTDGGGNVSSTMIEMTQK